jgi:hypothetical protein
MRMTTLAFYMRVRNRTTTSKRRWRQKYNLGMHISLWTTFLEIKWTKEPFGTKFTKEYPSEEGSMKDVKTWGLQCHCQRIKPLQKVEKENYVDTSVPKIAALGSTKNTKLFMEAF